MLVVSEQTPVFTSLHIEEIDGSLNGRQLYALDKPLEMRLGFNGGGVKVKVPENALTDFASVPRILWPLCPPNGKWSRAAVVHDYLCGTKGCSRFLADSLFREAMYRLGVPVWRRVPMYYAVRLYSIFLWCVGGQG